MSEFIEWHFCEHLACKFISAMLVQFSCIIAFFYVLMRVLFVRALFTCWFPFDVLVHFSL